MNSTKCFLYGAKGKSKDRFAQNLKVANRSFSVVETLSGGSSKRIHARAAGGMIMPPKGSTQRGAPLGDSLVTFSSGRKSPGARGWKHRQGEECRGRGAAPPRIGRGRSSRQREKKKVVRRASALPEPPARQHVKIAPPPPSGSANAITRTEWCSSTPPAKSSAAGEHTASC